MNQQCRVYACTPPIRLIPRGYTRENRKKASGISVCVTSTCASTVLIVGSRNIHTYIHTDVVVADGTHHLSAFETAMRLVSHRKKANQVVRYIYTGVYVPNFRKTHLRFVYRVVNRKWKMVQSVFRVSPKMSFGFGIICFEQNRRKIETETDHSSVVFSGKPAK